MKKVSPFWQGSGIQLYNEDCRKAMDSIEFDFVLTDPPYPDHHTEEYGYFPPTFLDDFSCRQLVFWSAKAEFPLSYTAIHIWNKQRGVGSEYERIFERNGQRNYKLFTAFSMDSYRAKITREGWTGHLSQKPLMLMRKLILKFAPAGAIIFDPFAGSGSTLVACRDLGFRAIGCEISEKWCMVAAERLAQKSLFDPTEGNFGIGPAASQQGKIPGVGDG